MASIGPLELNLHKWVGKDRDKLSSPTANNIVWPKSYTGTFVPSTSNHCKPTERSKTVGGNHKVGLHLFTPPDAIHWSKRDRIFTGGTGFHEHHLLDTERKQYTLYFRTVRDRLRSIDVSYSHDLLNWTEPVPLQYGNSPPQQMYTMGSSVLSSTTHSRWIPNAIRRAALTASRQFTAANFANSSVMLMHGLLPISAMVFSCLAVTA